MANVLNSVTTRVRGRLRYRKLTRPPVIVGGCERSGTTLLLSILSSHPAIQAIPVETWAFCFRTPYRGAGEHTIRMSRLYRCLGEGPESPESTAEALCRHIGEPFPAEMRRWWQHAEVRRSEHVRSGKITPIFASSVRKFERPDFPFAERVRELMDEPGAMELFERFGYL